jgi:hypothetical protein
MQNLRREQGGCTVGVAYIGDGMLFFKNRDLGGEYVANQVTTFQSTLETHALRGLNLETKEPEGVSIGVNRHRICVANTHIVSTPDVTYDILCDRLIAEAQEKRDVPRIVKDFMAHNRLQGGRILVASPAWGFLVEVFEDLFRIDELGGGFVITNHFSLLPHRPERSEEREQSSWTRLRVAARGIQDVGNIGVLKSLLRSHSPFKGELSICNHRQDGGGTESSHIIQVQGGYVGWSYLSGYACENDYRTIRLFQG